MTVGEGVMRKGNRLRGFFAGIVAASAVCGGVMYLDGYVKQSTADGVTADMAKGIMVEKQ